MLVLAARGMEWCQVLGGMAPLGRNMEQDHPETTVWIQFSCPWDEYFPPKIDFRRKPPGTCFHHVPGIHDPWKVVIVVSPAGG
jgi:hypothetical protein